MSLSNNKNINFSMELPIKLNINSKEDSININGVCIPLSTPFSLSIRQELNDNKVRAKGFSLPFSLPFTLSPPAEGSVGRRKITKKVTTSEQAWVFQGIVFDEYIIAKMNKSVTMIEEVKSRILTDITLIDKNHVKIKWYGNPVDAVQVFTKLDIDSDYNTDGVVIPWEEGEVTIPIGDGSYNILLDTPNNSGISGVINISDTNFNKVKSDFKIVLNEKTYYLNTNFKQTFNINIDF